MFIRCPSSHNATDDECLSIRMSDCSSIIALIASAYNYCALEITLDNEIKAETLVQIATRCAETALSRPFSFRVLVALGATPISGRQGRPAQRHIHRWIAVLCETTYRGSGHAGGHADRRTQTPRDRQLAGGVDRHVGMLWRLCSNEQLAY